MTLTKGHIGKNKHFIAIAVSALIVMAIFVPFRAEAFTLDTTGLKTSFTTASSSSPFSVVLEVQSGEHIPVQKIGVLIDGSTVAEFDIDGNKISGNNVVTLSNPNVPSNTVNGYGYGYGYTYGYGYSYGYGYVYVGNYYSYSTSNPFLNGFSGPITVTYPATINPSLLAAGSHTFQSIIYTGVGTNIVSTPSSFTVTSAGTITSPVTLSITSKRSDTNTAITGMFNKVTVGSSTTNILGSDFTPNSYTLNANTAYTVFASDFGQFVFDHWETSGGTTLPSSVNLRGTAVNINSGTLSLVAVYRVADVATIAVTSSSATFNNVAVSGLTFGTVSIQVVGVTGTGNIFISNLAASSLPSSVITISGGTSTVSVANTGDFVVGTLLEVDTSQLTFDSTGSITITVPYSESALQDAGLTETESNVRVLHFDGAEWQDITVASSLDTINNTVQGKILGGSASPVAVAFGPISSGSSSSGSSGGHHGGHGGSSSCVNCESTDGGQEGGSTGGTGQEGTEDVVSYTQSFSLAVDGQTFDIQYNITGATVEDMTLDKESNTLMVSIDATADGNLKIKLPRNVIDSRTGEDGTSGSDKPFSVVLDDSGEMEAEEGSPTASDRQLSIDFSQNDSEVAIMGTHVVPEFGSIAAIVLAISIVGIIIASTRFNSLRGKFGGLTGF